MLNLILLCLKAQRWRWCGHLNLFLEENEVSAWWSDLAQSEDGGRPSNVNRPFQNIREYIHTY
jgi:hypothetical protein